jgi:hypothetical protein
VKANRHFPGEVLAALEKTKGLRIRAGTGSHRFIGIWFVLVKGRVFVRSWSVTPDGWYRTFLREPQGAIQVGKLEIAVRTVPIRSKVLRDAVDRAYLEKYNSGGELKYAKDLAQEKSRATTIELTPFTGSELR